MKKVLRILCLIMLSVIICLNLSGCIIIDGIREAQAFWGEENIIKYGEYEYMLLPESENLQPICNEYNSVYVTEEDVPVLLSSAFGTYFDLSDDGIFIFTLAENGYTCYCRTDRYDEMWEKIVSGFEPDSYCYTYYDYEESEDAYYVFSADEAEAVNSVVQSVIPTVMPEAAALDYDYIVSVEACTDDMLFRSFVADICITGEEYYVVLNDGEDTLLYKVPDDMRDTFIKIMKIAVESENEFSHYYEDFEAYE